MRPKMSFLNTGDFAAKRVLRRPSVPPPSRQRPASPDTRLPLLPPQAPIRRGGEAIGDARGPAPSAFTRPKPAGRRSNRRRAGRKILKPQCPGETPLRWSCASNIIKGSDPAGFAGILCAPVWVNSPHTPQQLTLPRNTHTSKYFGIP